ncbi:hypothetical protein ZWY2020_022703 [Hordeum vulgare]|nr:hypothetical protein ZWY2020_022703 [Hordeum vulgare]
MGSGAPAVAEEAGREVGEGTSLMKERRRTTRIWPTETWIRAAGEGPPLVKYVGDGEEQNGGLQMTGLNLMDKTPALGARLAFNIWDVAGDSKSADHVPIACKDAVAILFMFDLTSRCTLNK